MNTAAVTAPAHGWPRLRRSLSDALLARRGRLLALLLVPPLLWLGVLYVGSLLALLANSFFGLDEFTGQVAYEFTLKNFVDIFTPANLDVIGRTVAMALAVTLACAALGFPIAYYMARYTSGAAKAFCFILVMLPLWSSYLVRLYAWKLLLAKEGAVNWVLAKLHLTWLLEALLALPLVGGPSLSFSALGTFLVFVYLWLPYMILPIQAAVERIAPTVIEASGDLGAHGGATFRHVILPMALPGVFAGSIFTFSLTLGDYIVPGVVGDSRLFIGQVVYMQQGVAGNVPFAAAFSLVPIVVIAVYLWFARRKGAFDAL
jgi:putative spermidine/putrescine transport system permease protein